MAVTATDVRALRAFNRTWTATAGLLQAGLLDSPYTLTEARVLFELAQRDAVDGLDVAELRRSLGLDSGYLSRIVQRFRADGLVATEPSPDDGRRQVARLTDAGREAFADLDRRSIAQVTELLTPLDPARRADVRAAMETLTAVFGPDAPAEAAVVAIRAPEPGDLGWIVSAHGALYAREHGWDATFEALVARIVADYVEHHDPSTDRMWIAERAGRPVGSIACVHGDDADTVKLRILLVDPSARGLGAGGRLVDECVAFARTTGARRMVLFTVDELTSARRIYEAAGFTLVDSEPSAGWGVPVVEQTWALELNPPP